MFFPGTPNIFVPGDSVFMLFKCMCNNISIEKKLLSCSLGAGFAASEGAEDNILTCAEFKISSVMSISEVAKFSPSKLSGSSLPLSVTPEELAKKYGIVVGLSLGMASNSSKQGGF